MHEIVIREEKPDDAAAIRTTNKEAFESDVEADLVDVLRQTCAERLSLVAVVDELIVGHILYTPVVGHAGSQDGYAGSRDGRARSKDGRARSKDGRAGSQEVKGVGLAPMAVRPPYQRKGVGSALVRRSMEMIRADGYKFIVVVGHPYYYLRFGFERASIYGLTCEFDGVPDEAFMIAVFDHDAVGALSGVISYRPEFSALT